MIPYKYILKVIPLLAFIWGCAPEAAPEGSDTNAESSQQNNGGDDGGATCEAVDLPDAPPAGGQLVFTVDESVDPCEVSGYVVGYQEDLKVELANDGSLFINNIPPGEFDVVVGTLAVPALHLNAAKKKALRLGKSEFLAGVRKNKNKIDLPIAGGISGKVTLSGQTDHAGIKVYIPGTSFDATTDSNGNYTISPIVPVGINNLYFEKDGYHRGQVENIEVEEDSVTSVNDVSLVLSTGAEGFIATKSGDNKFTSHEVPLVIGATPDAVLMKISESDTFNNVSWIPVNTSTVFSFESDGVKKLYIKFADANGLESSPYEIDLIVDETPPVLEQVTGFGEERGDGSFILWGDDATYGSDFYYEYRYAPIQSEITESEWIPWRDAFYPQVDIPSVFRACFQLRNTVGLTSEIVCGEATYTYSTSKSRAKPVTLDVDGSYLIGPGYQLDKTVDIFDVDDSIWSIQELSLERSYVGGASYQDIALFVGGRLADNSLSHKVDIYNKSNDTWTTSILPEANSFILGSQSGASANGIIGFAGGSVSTGSAYLYDTSTGQWSTSSLSQSRSLVSVIGVGKKLLFAGGSSNSSVVDIYDTESMGWTTANLSAARVVGGAASTGKYGVFLFGYTTPSISYPNVVDIYNAETNSWSSVNHPSICGEEPAVAAADNKVFIGGYNSIEILDLDTMTWTEFMVDGVQFCSGGGASNGSNVIIFDSTGTKFYVYDIETGEWSNQGP